MSLATLHPPVLNLDPKRIAATSAAIAVHAFAFLLLLAPVQFSPKAEPVDTVDDYIPFEEKIMPPPPPPPPPVNVTTNPPRTNTPVQEVMEQLTPAPIDQVIPQLPPADLIADEFPPGNFETIAPSGPRELTVLVGPAPTYPISELRAGVEGKVVLRIEVDATGKPFDGSIESSSGSRALDRAALKFVLAKWRFEPARHMGQPIAATALVPVEFIINQ